MDKGETTIDAGSVEFAMSYRKELMDDQGLCVQVYSVIDGTDTEILRFDCFDQAPHYHYGPENHNIRLFMDKTTAGNPLGWTLNNINNNKVLVSNGSLMLDPEILSSIDPSHTHIVSALEGSRNLDVGFTADNKGLYKIFHTG